MARVGELRARVTKLSLEIDLQRAVLKDLEKDKSLAQRELNAVLDPVARLPLELSSEIFLQTLQGVERHRERMAPSFPEPRADHLPLLFLNICHAWTDIALSMPELWSAVRIDLPWTGGFKGWLQLWLKRAGNHPLRVSLQGPATFDRRITTVIWSHRHQLKHLELVYQNESTHNVRTIDFFGLGVSPGPLPLLEMLVIRGLSEIGEWGAYSGHQIFELLRSAPNLVECVFENLQCINGFNNHVRTEKVVHHTLRRVMFGRPGQAPSGDDEILACFTLPALERLSLSMRQLPVHDLLSFLRRSSPPLRDLVLGPASHANVALRVLMKCLQLMPTLTRFEMWFPQSRFMEDILNALAESSTLFPILDNLTIYLSQSPHFDSSSFWPALLRALSSRRLHLRNVRIEMRDDTAFMTPADHLISAFRDLAAEGMHLYVGSGKDGHRNLISI
ncbi:hypothetical protein C8R47DRAFT_1268454 [Mycena vitilis]|nr:hypothetical protein C8R47DRAFT_1268454 [Mycena vitilis]